MNDLCANKAGYLRAWEQVLIGWLNWSREDFEALCAHYEDDLDDRAPYSLFYHDTAMYHISEFLIPAELEARLDSNNKLKWRIIQAVEQGGHPECKAEFDWATAKARVEAVLREYGATIPSSGHEEAKRRAMYQSYWNALKDRL